MKKFRIFFDEVINHFFGGIMGYEKIFEQKGFYISFLGEQYTHRFLIRKGLFNLTSIYTKIYT